MSAQVQLSVVMKRAAITDGAKVYLLALPDGELEDGTGANLGMWLQPALVPVSGYSIDEGYPFTSTIAELRLTGRANDCLDHILHSMDGNLPEDLRQQAIELAEQQLQEAEIFRRIEAVVSFVHPKDAGFNLNLIPAEALGIRRVLGMS